jgi:carotenoid 1,2-hydratase
MRDDAPPPHDAPEERPFRLEPDPAPRFDRPVPPGGYLWWYVDALSDDGRHGLTIIAFVGSVFSPYYFWAGRADPENHVCLNVALYGPRGRWTMTERGRRAAERAPALFRIGPSALRWEGGELLIDIDETAVPHLAPVRGRVRVIPSALNPRAFDLDAPRRHHWRAIAPVARVEVDMARPAQRWSGAGYLDMNWGEEPLEAGFSRWDWSRAATRSGGAVLYDATRRDGSALSLGLRFDGAGAMEQVAPPPRVDLPPTLWRVPRRTQADPGHVPVEVRRLEDAPFYARAELRSRVFGEDAHTVHETVDADRFATRWVKLLLPWRMPRLPG